MTDVQKASLVKRVAEMLRSANQLGTMDSPCPTSVFGEGVPEECDVNLAAIREYDCYRCWATAMVNVVVGEMKEGKDHDPR